MKTRSGARVIKDRFDDLEALLAEVERRGGELQEEANASPVDLRFGKKFEPVQQVTARIELAGPGVRAGIDVRGDGSAEAWTGRVRRSLVKQLPRESPYEALRRAVTQGKPRRG